MPIFKVLVYGNSDLVKRFTVAADSAEEAIVDAKERAAANFDDGDLSGWDMCDAGGVTTAEVQE
jgi:hypothetical protein